MKSNEYQIKAASSWLRRRGYEEFISAREFADFCNDVDLGFNDAWLALKSTAFALATTDEFVQDIKEKKHGR